MSLPRGERGQATVELVLLIPLLLAAGIAVYAVLAAGRAREQASAAAHGAAVALLQERDPRAAARTVMPPGERERMDVRVAGRRVVVRVVPAVPMFGERLVATARADAGAAPGASGAAARAAVASPAGAGARRASSR